MMRLFFPFILVAAAVGLFVVYTNPTYQTIKQLSVQNASYDDALTKAQQLHQLRDTLLAKYNAFSPDDLDKLQHALPDNVDNIRLIIDINNIASRHNLSLASVDLGDLTAGKDQTSDTTANTGDVNPVGSVEVSFSVSTSNFNDFLAFVQDLEHSLRLIDITKLSFSAASGDSGSVTYALSVRTYWLH